ncbi:MAG: TatD family hydrolase [Desulfomonilia bacterium]|jgi:TatD DNase family protein
MNITDSHSHLHFSEFDPDRDEVIERAAQVGVSSMLLVGIDPEDSAKAVSVAASREGLFAAVGVHPQLAGERSPGEVLSLEALAADPKVVAVGETGFDLYRKPETEAAQAELFRAHIELARKSGLPLVIHDRNAHEQTFKLLEEEDAWALGGVFHCFSGSASLASYVIGKGFLVSVPGVVTYRNARQLREAVNRCPLDALLVETDAPFLAPVPHRGKRNEPSFLTNTIAEIAAIKGCSPDEVADAATSNFLRLFSRAQIP